MWTGTLKPPIPEGVTVDSSHPGLAVIKTRRELFSLVLFAGVGCLGGLVWIPVIWLYGRHLFVTSTADMHLPYLLLGAVVAFIHILIASSFLLRSITVSLAPEQVCITFRSGFKRSRQCMLRSRIDRVVLVSCDSPNGADPILLLSLLEGADGPVFNLRRPDLTRWLGGVVAEWAGQRLESLTAEQLRKERPA